MSWGNKLMFAFIAFALLMGTLVYKCIHQNYELVSSDYYSEELRFQDKIDGANKANKLSDLLVTQDQQQVTLQLPDEMKGLVIKGKLWFYCATNASKDRKLPLQVNDEGQMIISKGQLAKTSYQVKITWEAGADKYYKEIALTVD